MGKENKWKDGLCTPLQEIDEYSSIGPQNKSGQTNKTNDERNDTSCYPMFYDGCKLDSDCCTSLLCDKRPGVKTGTCKPYTALKILNEDNEWIECFENWYEYCTEDEECCSGICNQFDSFTNSSSNWTSFGVCVPDIRIVPVTLINEILANHSKAEAEKKQTNQQSRTRNKRSLSVEDKKVICYIGSWANYKKGDGKFVCHLYIVCETEMKYSF